MVIFKITYLKRYLPYQMAQKYDPIGKLSYFYTIGSRFSARIYFEHGCVIAILDAMATDFKYLPVGDIGQSRVSCFKILLNIRG